MFVAVFFLGGGDSIFCGFLHSAIAGNCLVFCDVFCSSFCRAICSANCGQSLGCCLQLLSRVSSRRKPPPLAWLGVSTLFNAPSVYLSYFLFSPQHPALVLACNSRTGWMEDKDDCLRFLLFDFSIPKIKL